MSQLDQLRGRVRDFCDERDWAQFHSGRNLAISLALESSELLELFQWGDLDTSDSRAAEKLSHELADVFYWVLRLSDHFEVDLESALTKKLELNAKKYPVDLARGTSKKYTDL